MTVIRDRVSIDAPPISPTKDVVHTFAIGTNTETTATTIQMPSPHTPKPLNRLLRWNLLWFIGVCIVIVPLPLWLYPLHCLGGFIAICSVTVWSCIVLFMCALHATYSMLRLTCKRRQHSYQVAYSKMYNNTQITSVVHMVLMAAYKEPLDVIYKTMDSLAAQTQAKRIFAVIAFEQRTPEVDEKSEILRKRYSNSFLQIIFTKHSLVEGEIPGKCSNASYAARTGVKVMKDMGIYSPEHCTFTTCDTDNLFPSDYLETLADMFYSAPDKHEVIWQPPLFYNFDLDQRPFFVRVTGILRGVFVIGLLLPYNINAMSVYSMSVKLMESYPPYFHPGYQFVDALDSLIRMITVGRTVPLRFLPCPVISGPTSGVTYKQELVEWARQAWRWQIGCAEIFHYFLLKWRKFSFFSAVRYGITFTHYYAFFLCAMALFTVMGIISTNVFNSVGVCKPSVFLPNIYLNYIPLFGLGFAYVMFAYYFFIDRWAVKILNVKEDIGVCRNIVHFITTPFVLLAYSCVTYFAIAELAVRGKKVCTHGSSKKAGLA